MSERSAHVPPVPHQTLPRPATTPRLESMLALLAAVERLAAAATVDDIATAAVDAAAEITGARGSALALQHGDAAEILASVGYDCDSMGAGTRLPLTAGLPITESVRTGRTVVRGEPGAPAWVAVALVAGTARGSLLVSLRPDADADVVALQTLAAAAGRALDRARSTTEERTALAHLASGLGVAPLHPPAWLDAAATVQTATSDPRHPGGDVVALVPGSSPDVAWLLVGDVCGEGPAAAPAAAQFRHVGVALARDDMAPETLLDAIDAALQRDPTAERFVTAAVVRLRRARHAVEATIATAGHPAALLWRAGEVTAVGQAGLPLNLGLPADRRPLMRSTVVVLRPDDLLLVHTDGFVDRGTADRTQELVELFGRAGVLGEADAVVELLVGAMTEAVDPPRDDLAVVVVSPRL